MADEETKEVLKQALREWLDEKFATFGRWTMAAFLSTLVFAVVYFMLGMNGFHK